MTEQRGYNEIQTTIQDGFVTPRGVGDYVMKRLMHTPHIIGRQSGGHRFHALSFPWQQQTSAIVLQRKLSVSVPRGFCQALDICRKASFLEPGAVSLLTKQFYIK